MGGKRRVAPRAASRDALAKSAALTERIIEAAPGGIVHVAADGNILRANAEALRILGLSFDEISKKYTVDFETETIFEDGSPCLAGDYPVSKALMTGEPQRAVTIGVRRPDGKVSWAVFNAIPVKDGGNVTGAVVTFLDITERKRVEEARRESEATLSAVLNSAPSVILKADLDGTIRYVNRSVIPDRSVDELIGSCLFDIIPRSKQALVRSCFEGVVATKQPDGYEISRDNPDGSATTYSVAVGPVLDGDQVCGVTMIATDITELRALRTRLVVADRLASVGTLAAGVAHEINNPLTYLLFKLSKLQRAAAAGGDADPKRLGDIELALEGADRIRRIVEDLGTFARTSGDELEAVQIEPVVDLATKMAANEMRFRATLVRDYASGLPPVRANESRLGQVFVNLLINAVQAIDEGDVANNEIRIATALTDDGRVRVSVSDTGHGIDEELLGRVFEPFVTTKPRGQGTGLGLHICHSIVTAMDGELQVTSVPGQGSTFSVILPVATAMTHPEPSPPSVAEVPGRPLSILVVDDEAPIHDVFRVLLDHHKVVSTSSGREAIARLDQDDFDLVFCDLIMPDLTGMDVYSHLSASRPKVTESMVFMTGGVFTNRAKDFLGTIPNKVLRKPFSMDDVRSLVAETARRL